MKRSYLHETYLKPNSSISSDLFPDEKYSSWEIADINMEEPITPSVILKRYVYET